jgi:hypothetical protein
MDNHLIHKMATNQVIGARFVVFNTGYTKRLVDFPMFMQDMQEKVESYGNMVGIVDSNGIWYVPKNNKWIKEAGKPLEDRIVPKGSIVFEVRDTAHTWNVLRDFHMMCKSNGGMYEFCGCFNGVPMSVNQNNDLIVFKFDCESG